MQTQGLKKTTMLAMMWTSSAQIVVQLTQIVVNIVLARLLFPKDFGLAGMAMTFMTVVLSTSEIGFGSAIVQAKKISDKQLSTYFWLNLAIGILCFILTILFAPLIASVFGDTDLQPMIRVVSIVFLFQAFGVIQSSLLSKKMDFKSLSIANVLGVFIYCIIAITLAVLKFNAWSLVIAGIAQSIVYTLVVWLFGKWRPIREFDLKSIKDLFIYGINLWGGNISWQLSQNVDYFIIGKILGPSALGYYTISFKMADLIRNRIVSIVSTVAFPALSLIQDDTEHFKRAYLSLTRYVALVVYPIMTVLLLYSSVLIPIVYGAKWQPSVLPFQILVIMGFVSSTISSTTTVFLARGKTQFMMKTSTITLFLLAVFAYIGTYRGIAGVALGVTIANSIMAIPRVKFCHQLIDVRMREFGRALYPAVLGSIAVGVWIVSTSLISPANGLIAVVLRIVISVAIYFGVLSLVARDELLAIANTVRKKFSAKESGAQDSMQNA